jgi:O-antigen ligase
MKQSMIVGLSFLAIGIFISVSILGASQALIAIPALYYSFQAFQKNELKFPTSSWCLLAFSLVALISCLINHDILLRVSKNYGSIKYPIIAVLTPFALIPFLKKSSEKLKKQLVNLFLISIVIAAVYGLIKMEIKEMPRLKGFTDTMRYGYGTGMIIAFLGGLALRKELAQKYSSWPLLLISVATALVALYFTKTRGAMVALLFSGVFIFFLHKKKTSYVIGLIFLALFSTMLSFYFFGKGESSNRYLVNKNNSSDQIRRSQWMTAMKAISERPIIGWGPSNFHSQVERIKNQYDLPRKDYNNAHSHNVLLETFAGTGIFGLLALVGWLVFWMKEVWVGNPTWKILMIPFFISLLVGSQFELITDANNASMIYFLYSLSVSINRNAFS